ncbi:helix-turn-helix transcriptional regulator [Comamonas sp.]|uniref:helix-turn-helix transcriptional regulator n=1 Tax=Comamonas sp. TaxID=34028 RepID=UPI003A943C24
MKLLDRKALCAKVPYSDRWILKLEAVGRFPKRIVLLPRRVAWDEAEIDAWIESRRQSNEKAAAPQANFS